VDIALMVASVSPFATPEYLQAFGEAAEEHGFSAIWAPEHVVVLDEYESLYPYDQSGKMPGGGETGILEPFDTLAFLAAVTSRIRLGTGICIVPQRNPVYTAKQVATVDWLSNGRVDFGIGVGWLREEFDVTGTPFEERGPRTRDYVEAMRRLWCDPVSQYDGKYYRVPACRMYPKPVQQPHPPVYFGGESDAALRRVADTGDGWLGFNHTPETAAERIKVLELLLADRGRRRDDVTISVSPYMLPIESAALAGYRDAGADQVVLPAFAFDPDSIRELIAGMADDWIATASRL
jgi:probable F420-dependent oxidoreductase